MAPMASASSASDDEVVVGLSCKELGWDVHSIGVKYLGTTEGGSKNYQVCQINSDMLDLLVPRNT